ncbi:MAG: isochorismatase family protein, partial [Bacteroidales bacterium]|nr:isochorismatase family protein [Bacteroidales bacterium]
CQFEHVYKPTFGSINLAKRIGTLYGTYDIEIVGFCTDICVVSNALLLKARLYNVADIKVIENCCAGTTPENHEAALAVMRSCQIDVV